MLKREVHCDATEHITLYATKGDDDHDVTIHIVTPGSTTLLINIDGRDVNKMAAFLSEVGQEACQL